ncbi:hypothetical protein CALCODRAFT_265700 [Calocera cornea HHB12733]|uniref:Uncharacterized protein n=1 Tax=Calocera cornea HHB12733 TaxID=1353952 RepID=A0A165GE55_9BASI|nr:hypothetical protein CALCODRAFT_265700 [Calocera cornea HHB12733]
MALRGGKEDARISARCVNEYLGIASTHACAAYVILIMPITLCRLLELSGFPVSSLAFFFSFSIFSLTGLVNGLILIWASKVLQTKQWKLLIDYWTGRSPRSSDIESLPRIASLEGEMVEKPAERMSAFSHLALRTGQASAPSDRPPLPPLITDLSSKRHTSKSEKDEGLGRNESLPSKYSRHSGGSHRTISTFFSETPLVALPPVRPLITRKPVPPIIPKRSSLRTKFKRFSASMNDRLKAIEGISPIEEPSTSILERFPLPPLPHQMTDLGRSKRGSKSAPTSPRPTAPRVHLAPGGPRGYRTLPSHPAVYRQSTPSDTTTSQSPTAVEIVITALRSDDGDGSDSDGSAESLRPVSAKSGHSWYSSSTIKPRTNRRSRASSKTTFTFVTAPSEVGTVSTPRRGVAL